jgi:hypothetical protein
MLEFGVAGFSLRRAKANQCEPRMLRLADALDA